MNEQNLNVCINGIYEYVYEHNTDDLIENHYIEFVCESSETFGSYFGTSDDFDQAREGYLPGFFKSEMKNLLLSDTAIQFKLVVNDSIFFTKAITPYSDKDSKRWEYGIRYKERYYTGRFKGDTIIIQTEDFDPRLFVKRK